MDLDPKQLLALTLIVSMTGATGGSLLARMPARSPTPSLYPPGVIREEIDRLEQRTDRRLEALQRRIRELERWEAVT